MSRKFRRAALVGVALVLVIGNVWWITREEPAPVKAFELTPTFGGDHALENQRAPLDFDAATSTWTLRGRAISDVRNHVERQLFETPLDGAGPEPIAVPGALRAQGLAYVPVHEDSRRTVDEMRRLLLTLVQDGICQVGLVGQQGSGSADEAASGRVELYGIIAVRDDEGRRLACTPAQAG